MRRHPLDPVALIGGLMLAGIGLLAVIDPDRARGLDLTLVASGGLMLLGLALLLGGLTRRGGRRTGSPADR